MAFSNSSVKVPLLSFLPFSEEAKRADLRRRQEEEEQRRRIAAAEAEQERLRKEEQRQREVRQHTV